MIGTEDWLKKGLMLVKKSLKSGEIGICQKLETEIYEFVQKKNKRNIIKKLNNKNKIMTVFQKHGLKMNLDKTEVMWVGKQREELNIRLEGKDIIKASKEFCVSGWKYI